MAAERKHGTSIEWTHGEGYVGQTWNPVTGCSKVSPGCANCYAETLSLRRGWSELPWTPENAEANVVLHPERLGVPLRRRKPTMWFVNSMSDLFHELVPDEFIASVFDVMSHCPQHVFQVLTKRPERMQEVVLRLATCGGAEAHVAIPDGPYCTREHGSGRPMSWTFPPTGTPPVRNVWLGTSIENRRFVHRAEALRHTPAAVRFISAEPLLGPLVCDIGPGGEPVWDYDGAPLDLSGIDWLIVGGESGLGYRLMHGSWVEDLYGAARAQGTAFFMKQDSGSRPGQRGRIPDYLWVKEMPR